MLPPGSPFWNTTVSGGWRTVAALAVRRRSSSGRRCRSRKWPASAASLSNRTTVITRLPTATAAPRGRRSEQNRT